MGKPWFVSSVLDQLGRSNIILIAIAALFSGLTFGAEELPTFDLERLLSPGSKEESVKVGDRLQFRVHLKIPDGHSGSDIFKDMTVEAPQSVSLAEEGWSIQTQLEAGGILQGFPMKPGVLTLPSLLLKDQKGLTIAKTQAILGLKVESAISSHDPKPDQLEEIEAPVGLEFPWRRVLLIGLGCLISLLIGGYGIYRLRKLRKPVELKLACDLRKEDEIALEQLNELGQTGVGSHLTFKAFYFRLSEIIKAYVGARYGFDALECTTSEMLQFLESQQKFKEGMTENLSEKVGPDDLRERFSSLFERLDRVKFTDYLPKEEEPGELVEKAKNFVRLTRRAEVKKANSHAVC